MPGYVSALGTRDSTLGGSREGKGATIGYGTETLYVSNAVKLLLWVELNYWIMLLSKSHQNEDAMIS